jgi:fumarate hydratase subunit beta
MKSLLLPLSPETKQSLRAGEKILVSGTVYSARDAAHQRLVAALAQGQSLPFDLQNATLFYVGPTPLNPEGRIGAAGPTTSSRMDPYTIPLLNAGVSAVIGKGARSSEVKSALIDHGAIYLVAIGGAGALLARSIEKMELIAYPELGPEAIYKMELCECPVYVGLDLQRHSIYQRSV